MQSFIPVAVVCLGLFEDSGLECWRLTYFNAYRSKMLTIFNEKKYENDLVSTYKIFTTESRIDKTL